MIVFLLLGFVAGVLNVMRAAGVVAPSKLPGGKRRQTVKPHFVAADLKD